MKRKIREQKHKIWLRSLRSKLIVINTQYKSQRSQTVTFAPYNLEKQNQAKSKISQYKEIIKDGGKS